MLSSDPIWSRTSGLAVTADCAPLFPGAWPAWESSASNARPSQLNSLKIKSRPINVRRHECATRVSRQRVEPDRADPGSGTEQTESHGAFSQTPKHPLLSSGDA